MRTPEEIQQRLAEIAHEHDKAKSNTERGQLNRDRYLLRWVLGHSVGKPQRLASKIIKNHLAE